MAFKLLVKFYFHGACMCAFPSSGHSHNEESSDVMLCQND